MKIKLANRMHGLYCRMANYIRIFRRDNASDAAGVRGGEGGVRITRGRVAVVTGHSRCFRFLAWVNVFCQLVFPVALSFTPFMTAAETESNAHLPDLGGSVENPSGGSGGNQVVAGPTQQEGGVQAPPAGLNAARQLWGVLGSSSPRERGIEMATGYASGVANQAVQDWLSQYGTARFSFSTQGAGSADLLLPLLESPDYLLYSQAGVRRGDDRTTGNFGLGGRFFTPDWMFGVNAFYDNDFTGNNRRLGLGVEAWRDYLKLSANSYLRLSDWRQSPLHESRDYDERPANGFDIRAEGWLPAWPQLGGKLMYEHYQGKDVALNGDFNSRRNSPSAVTAGLSYTPFPLLKVGVEHREGAGTGDTALNLDFTYRFGVPWSEQINPQMVELTRTLAGTRYDLVDRNYNIVLQYRKQDLISVLLGADRNPGFSGESVMVTATVRSKYGLTRVDWSAPELLSAGGSLTPVEKDGSVVRVGLPSVVTPKIPLRARSAADGTRFVIEGVAHDTKGNEARATLELNVVRSTRDISARLVSDGAVADGRTVNTVEVLAQDTDTHQPLAGEEVELVFTYADGPEKGKVLDMQTVKTDEQGLAVASVSSRIAAGVSASIRLKSNGNSTDLNMAFVADGRTAKPGEPVVSGAGDVVADGKSEVTLTFPVTDTSGNPAAGQEVTFTTTNGAKPERMTVTTDEQGNASITVTSTVAGITTVTATVNGESQSHNIEFVAGAPEESRSELTVTPETLVANGGQEAIIHLMLRDGMGNMITLPGSSVRFRLSGPEGATLTGVTCDENGCTTSLSGINAGSVTLTPVVNGVELGELARTVEMKEDIGNRVLTVMNNSVPADDVTAAVVQLKVTGVGGKPLEGVHVEFSVDGPEGARFLTTDYATNDQGIASAKVVSPAAGEARVTATADGVSVSSDVITFVAAPDGAVFDGGPHTELPVAVTAGKTADVKFTVKDGQGRLLSGQPVKVSYFRPAEGGSGAVIVEETINSDDAGHVSVSAGSNKAGTLDVVAEVNGTRQTVTLTVEADGESPAKVGEAGGTTFSAAPDTLLPGESTALTLVLKDKYGNAISGRNDIESDGNRFTETSTPGTYQASLTVSEKALPGTQTVPVRMGATQLGELSLTVGSSNIPEDETQPELRIITSNSVADGKTPDVLELTLAGGNDAEVVFSVKPAVGTVGHATVTPVRGNMEGGRLNASVTSTAAGSFIVTAELNGKTVSETVAFIADASTALFGTPPENVTTVAGQSATVKFVVKDANGNPVKNQPVEVTANNGAIPSKTTVTTDDNGVASVDVSNNTAGDTTVTASVNGHTQDTKVTFGADSEHPAGTGKGGSVLTAPKELVAGEPATVTLDLKDGNGNAITGRTDITLSDGSVFTETGPGRYEASLQEDSTAAGNKEVSVLAGGTPLPDSAMSIPVKAGAASAENSSLEIQPGTFLADGKASATVTLKLQDSKGNPVTGKANDVNFGLTKVPSGGEGKVTLSKISEDTPGVYTATVSGTVPGEAEVTAGIDGTELRQPVTLLPDESAALVEGITVKEASVPADGKTANTLTAKVVNAEGKPVEGVTVSWSRTEGTVASLAGSTSVTDANGLATMYVTGTVAETAKFGAKVGANTGDTGKEAEAVFALYPVISSMEVTKDNSPADGVTANIVEMLVTDLAGNPLVGQDVTVTASGSASLGSSTGVTDAGGRFTLNVTDTAAEAPGVTAMVGTGTGEQKHTVNPVFGLYVKFSAVVVNATNDTVPGKTCQAPCDVTLSSTVVDAQGNPLSDVTVTVNGSVTGGNPASVTSGSDGKVSVTKNYTLGGVEDLSLQATAFNGAAISGPVSSDAVHVDIQPVDVVEKKSLTPTELSKLKYVDATHPLGSLNFNINESPVSENSCRVRVEVTHNVECLKDGNLVESGKACSVNQEAEWKSKLKASNTVIPGVIVAGSNVCAVDSSSFGEFSDKLNSDSLAQSSLPQNTTVSVLGYKIFIFDNGTWTHYMGGALTTSYSECSKYRGKVPEPFRTKPEYFTTGTSGGARGPGYGSLDTTWRICNPEDKTFPTSETVVVNPGITKTSSISVSITNDVSGEEVMVKTQTGPTFNN